MKRAKQCPKCESSAIITGAKLIESADYANLLVATYQKPDALVFKGQQTSSLSAWVCTDCGYLELYANNPKGLTP